MEVEHEKGIFVVLKNSDDVSDLRLVSSGEASEFTLSGLGSFQPGPVLDRPVPVEVYAVCVDIVTRVDSVWVGTWNHDEIGILTEVFQHFMGHVFLLEVSQEIICAVYA